VFYKTKLGLEFPIIVIYGLS